MVTLVGCSDRARSTDVAAVGHRCKPVIAVYPIWKHQKKELENLPWSQFSHIGIASIYPNSDGTLNTSGADKFIDELVALAHSKNKKVIVSVGGSGLAGKAFLDITKSNKITVKFVSSVVEFVSRNNLDGVDIDWEFWSYQNIHGKGGNDPIESQQLVILLKELKMALPTSKLLTVDIIAGHWFGGQYLPQIQEYADFVNLMAFDFTGAWPESEIGYHSSYDLFKVAIDSTIGKGFHRNKLLIGLPSYGIEFEGGKRNSIKHHSYSDIVEILNGDISKILSERVDNIYFESSESMFRKAQYIKDKGLGGAFLFEITSDHKNGKYSLFELTNSVINTEDCIL